jgi:hypothetical protein
MGKVVHEKHFKLMTKRGTERWQKMAKQSWKNIKKSVKSFWIHPPKHSSKAIFIFIPISFLSIEQLNDA